ncbi:hypothetical protein HDU96_001978, partial [Phlyctochytrium bullatum]
PGVYLTSDFKAIGLSFLKNVLEPLAAGFVPVIQKMFPEFAWVQKLAHDCLAKVFQANGIPHRQQIPDRYKRVKKSPEVDGKAVGGADETLVAEVIYKVDGKEFCVEEEVLNDADGEALSEEEDMDNIDSENVSDAHELNDDVVRTEDAIGVSDADPLKPGTKRKREPSRKPASEVSKVGRCVGLPIHKFFGCAAYNINCMALPHKDLGDHPAGWCFVVPIGDYKGGEIVLVEAGLEIALRPGQIIAFRSSLFTHFNRQFEGFRNSIVFFTCAKVYKIVAAYLKTLNTVDANENLTRLNDFLNFAKEKQTTKETYQATNEKNWATNENNQTTKGNNQTTSG